VGKKNYKGCKKNVTNIITLGTVDMINDLSKKYGCSKSSVVEVAVNALWMEKIGNKKEKK
jgi:hypothetical protein